MKKVVAGIVLFVALICGCQLWYNVECDYEAYLLYNEVRNWAWTNPETMECYTGLTHAEYDVIEDMWEGEWNEGVFEEIVANPDIK